MILRIPKATQSNYDSWTITSPTGDFLEVSLDDITPFDIVNLLPILLPSSSEIANQVKGLFTFSGYSLLIRQWHKSGALSPSQLYSIIDADQVFIPEAINSLPKDVPYLFRIPSKHLPFVSFYTEGISLQVDLQQIAANNTFKYKLQGPFTNTINQLKDKGSIYDILETYFGVNKLTLVLGAQQAIEAPKEDLQRLQFLTSITQPLPSEIFVSVPEVELLRRGYDICVSCPSVPRTLKGYSTLNRMLKTVDSYVGFTRIHSAIAKERNVLGRLENMYQANQKTIKDNLLKMGVDKDFLNESPPITSDHRHAPAVYSQYAGAPITAPSSTKFMALDQLRYDIFGQAIVSNDLVIEFCKPIDDYRRFCNLVFSVYSYLRCFLPDFQFVLNSNSRYKEFFSLEDIRFRGYLIRFPKNNFNNLLSKINVNDFTTPIYKYVIAKVSTPSSKKQKQKDKILEGISPLDRWLTADVNTIINDLYQTITEFEKDLKTK